MKFIESSYNSETGESKVVMQHLGVKFVGTAKVHPDDWENASSYEGCFLAEQRATILALKYERYLAKKKSDEAIDLIKACGCYKNFDKESPTAKAIYRQVNRRIKKVNDLTDEINTILKVIELHTHARATVLRAIKRKKEMSKKDN